MDAGQPVATVRRMAEKDDEFVLALRQAKAEYRSGRDAIGEIFAPLYSEGNLGARERAARHQFDVATVDLVVTGLEAWLAAGAKDRESAKNDRQSAKADREAEELKRDADRDAAKADRERQDRDRAAMNGFTKAIMVAAIASAFATGLSAIAMIVGIFKAPERIVIPAPIVAPAAAPVVNIPPIPVTLSPVINVTLPAQVKRAPK